MSIRALALGLVGAASLYAQHHHFSWQEECFNHPAAPYCAGHEYAVKPTPPASNNPRSIVTNPRSTPTGRANPSMVEIGGIDWRFADPFPDALVGFNFNALSASPLVRGLIGQLGASQGITEPDMQKIFDGLSGLDQVALSIRNNRVVVMITGSVADTTLPRPEAGLKAFPISASAMLVGHADAVDQAVQRIAMKGQPAELSRVAEDLQRTSEFWAVGSSALLGPQAASAGIKRFTLQVSMRDRLTSDMAFEFMGAPSADAVRKWHATLSAATLEGNVLHLRTSMEADLVRQKFAKLSGNPLGQSLAALVKAARYMPVRNAATPAPPSSGNRPVIYGLDDGPKEVGQNSN